MGRKAPRLRGEGSNARHLHPQRVRHFHQVFRAPTTQGEDRLFGLQRVAARPAQGPVHRREQRDGGTPAVFTQRDHGLRELQAFLRRRQERSTAVLHVEHQGGELEVRPGQAVLARAGEWVRYSTPDGAEYVAVCLPAFSPETVNRDDEEGQA